MIRTRIIGLALASTLTKAWLSLAGVVVLFQFFDSRAARKPSPNKSTK